MEIRPRTGSILVLGQDQFTASHTLSDRQQDAVRPGVPEALRWLLRDLAREARQGRAGGRGEVQR